MINTRAILICCSRIAIVTALLVIGWGDIPTVTSGIVNGTECGSSCNQVICNALSSSHPTRYTPLSNKCHVIPSTISTLSPLLAICVMLELCGIATASYEVTSVTAKLLFAVAAVFYFYTPLTVNGDYSTILRVALWLYYILSFALVDFPIQMRQYIDINVNKIVMIAGWVVPAVASLLPLLFIIYIKHINYHYGTKTVVFTPTIDGINQQPLVCNQHNCILTLCNIINNASITYIDITMPSTSPHIGCGNVCSILPAWLCSSVYILPLLSLIVVAVTANINTKITTVILSILYPLFLLFITIETMYLGITTIVVMLFVVVTYATSTIQWMQHLHQSSTISPSPELQLLHNHL